MLQQAITCVETTFNAHNMTYLPDWFLSVQMSRLSVTQSAESRRHRETDVPKVGYQHSLGCACHLHTAKVL